MLADGVYDLDFAAVPVAPDAMGWGLVVLQEGLILGADGRGGVFKGRYAYDSSRARSRVRLRVQVPPEGELVTGFVAGTDGARIDVKAAVEAVSAVPDKRLEATLDVAGKPVRVKLTWVGPLPN